MTALTPTSVAYNPFHGPRLLIAVIVICVLAAVARADDSTARDRKARAALALAGSVSTAPATPVTAVAPLPRPKVTSYPEGYAKATADIQPLVVFVGIPMHAVRGAVVAQADTFAGVDAPAVVVGYPVADRLMISTTLRGIPETGDVQRASDAAGKKIDAPPAKDMPAPKPLDWSVLRNDDSEAGEGDAVLCGFRDRRAARKGSQGGCGCTNCECVSAPGGVGTCGSFACPANGGKAGQAAQATPAVAPVAAPEAATQLWLHNGQFIRLPVGQTPPVPVYGSQYGSQAVYSYGAGQSSCPNGKCGLPQSGLIPQGFPR